jgi:hypothetical protein
MVNGGDGGCWKVCSLPTRRYEEWSMDEDAVKNEDENIYKAGKMPLCISEQLEVGNEAEDCYIMN